MSDAFIRIAQWHQQKEAEKKAEKAREKAFLGSLIGTVAGAALGSFGGPAGAMMGASAGASFGGAIGSKDPQAILQATIGAAGTSMQMYGASQTAARLGPEYTMADVLSMGGPGGGLALQQGVASLSLSAMQTKTKQAEFEAATKATAFMNTFLGEGADPAMLSALTSAAEALVNPNPATKSPPPAPPPAPAAPAPAPATQTSRRSSPAEAAVTEAIVRNYSNPTTSPSTLPSDIPLSVQLGSERLV